MRIATNVSSITAQRQLGTQQLGMNRALERLSSGLRVNRAADDAAGLAISETLVAQVRGMRAASANALDSINLIQTAEGGLEAATAMLQRLRELAVQAASDTYTLSDRAKIQEEVEQLKQELTRTAQTTQYNGRNLLDGLGHLGRGGPGRPGGGPRSLGRPDRQPGHALLGGWHARPGDPESRRRLPHRGRP
jgi:flagellin